MKPIKKLKLILEDTLSLMAELEGRNRNVLLQFTCYRNNRSVYQSTPIKRINLAQTLPKVCRDNKATELSLVITGANNQLETVELYNRSFILGTKEQQYQQQPTHYGQQGLGSCEPYPAMPQTWPGLAGLGAPPEAMVLARTMADDMRFRDDHERLSVEAERLRSRVKELEEEVKEHEATIEAKGSVIAMMENLKPFLPLATSLLGVDSRAGQALAGLSGTTGPEPEAPDDALTTAAIEMLREFMSTLHPNINLSSSGLCKTFVGNITLLPVLQTSSNRLRLLRKTVLHLVRNPNRRQSRIKSQNKNNKKGKSRNRSKSRR